MAMPANVTTVVVLGTFLTPEGTPSTGTVSFTPSSWLLNSGANIAIPNSTVTKALGTAGDFTVTLPITDDSDLSPEGWVYGVSEVVDGVSQSYNIAIPGTVAAGGTVYLADLAPVAPAGPEYYSLASSLAIGTVTNVGAGGTPTASITGLAPSQVLNLGVPQGLPGAPGSLNEPSVQQFAADGSVLRNLPARTLSAEALLKQAVWWIDSAHSSANGQAVTNLGWGGSALNAQLGSTGSADSNDPKYLDWTGENYVYLPGVASNFLSVPDEATFDALSDFDIRVRAALDDWTPSANSVLMSKWLTGDATFNLLILAGGVIRLQISTDGSTAINVDSTVATGVTDGATKWVRVTRGAAAGEVKFYLSDDAVTWTQLGTTVTGLTSTALFNSSALVKVGAFGATNTSALAGSVYRAQVLNGTTPVLDIDCSDIASGAATSFSARTGQTVTISRSTTGRKAVAVTHPCWLLGTDDYLEVPDNDLIDFGASDSFTVLAVVRQWATPASSATYLCKGVSASGRYLLRTPTTTVGPVLAVQDATPTAVNSTSQTGTSGSLGLFGGVADRAANTVASILNSTVSSTASIASVGSLANSEVLRVGRQSGASTAYQDFEFVAAAIFRRALTASEITTLTNYYAGRVGA